MGKYILIPLVISAVLLVAAFGLAYANFGNSNNLLVVHFDAFRGIDFLGDKYDVYSIIGIGAMLALINFVLVGVLYSRDKFLAWFTAYASMFITALIFIATLVIISNN